MSYGREFDFTRSAMEQMGELTNKVPKISLFLNRDGSENSEYTNHSGTLKNCYFCFGSWEDVDCLYCSMATHSTNCVDSTTITKCENCYFCVNTATSYDCIYCN